MKFIFALSLVCLVSCSQVQKPSLKYTISLEDPSSRSFHIELQCSGLKDDTVILSMPAWMPGYYQLMNYAEKVSELRAFTGSGKNLAARQIDHDSWEVINSGKSFRISYDVKANSRFVANNFLDSTHAYIVPAATFMHIDNKPGLPVTVSVNQYDGWDDIVTGLDAGEVNAKEFSAVNFDVLYDCPILAGNLEELPGFSVKGVPHRFVAYNPGDFDRQYFMDALKKIIEAATDIFDDIPYDEYTFIGIGPGYGGIEHLNNTTVSFDGSRMTTPASMTGMLKFLAHEYFHHYNVKRIRPFELGPFDYSRENRTSLLWVSEGLTVYYEYLIMLRAGLLSEEEFLASICSNTNAYENDPGKQYQSLVQSSYSTWEDGPFGSRDPSDDRSISCYDKGAVAGFILDLAIRHATGGARSLDDVMRLLYNDYYKSGRGFTDAEFRQACESVSGCSLAREFEYVHTTKPFDYDMYLSYAGLKIQPEAGKDKRINYTITGDSSGRIEKW